MQRKKNEDRGAFSLSITKEAQKSRLKVQEMACATMIACGWKDSDAYIASGLFNPLFSDLTNTKNMHELTNDNIRFREYVNTIKKKVSAEKADEANVRISEMSDERMQDSLSKENQLRELMSAKAQAVFGSKEWLDITKMIADITQVKKDKDADDDSTIHMYANLTCKTCALYEEAKKKAARQRMAKNREEE